MRIKYFFQQLFSHVSIIIISFLLLSLLFSQFIERFVYDQKIEELSSYGTSILADIEATTHGTQNVLTAYGTVLNARNIQFSIFDDDALIIYAQDGRGPEIKLNEEEWMQITKGYSVAVKQDFKRFDEGATFVLLPHFQQNEFVGGILLASPIKGLRYVIQEINRYLFYTVLITLAVSVILGWILSIIHVNRIKRIQVATSKVASGNYAVRIPSSNIDEIGDLANDFNAMVVKLEQSKEEIESLENRRRQFMADVSHELRTPLTTISGVMEGIQTGMIREEEKDRGMELVSKETKRLIRLVNENLDYEKIRANQITLYKEDIPLVELFAIVKDQLNLLAIEKNNTIHIEVEKSAKVYGDYDRLLQILINIVKNSIQFTNDGMINLTGNMTKTNTIIQITDTGSGMEQAEIEKIWQRFYKSGLSRARNPYGEFGLGLAIVKQLVKLHDGVIKVNSEMGQGTSFTIFFPRQKKDEF